MAAAPWIVSDELGSCRAAVLPPPGGPYFGGFRRLLPARAERGQAVVRQVLGLERLTDAPDRGRQIRLEVDSLPALVQKGGHADS